MPTQKPHERTEARRFALQIFYQGDILNKPPVEILKENSLVPETQLLSKYARRLIEGFSDHCQDIDEYLIEASLNWNIERMPFVDRSLLRLAAYEMIYVDEVPISVSINEAVNLAKEFGGDESSRFVNGILGRIATRLEEESAAQITESSQKESTSQNESEEKDDHE